MIDELPQTNMKSCENKLLASPPPPVYRIYSQEEAFLHMTRQRTKQEQELYLIVDEVLFRIWDALCVSIDDSCREEYLYYVPHVFDLLMKTSDGMEIFDYLVFIEQSQFDMPKNDLLVTRRAARVVEILLQYREEL